MREEIPNCGLNLRIKGPSLVYRSRFRVRWKKSCRSLLVNYFIKRLTAVWCGTNEFTLGENHNGYYDRIAYRMFNIFGYNYWTAIIFFLHFNICRYTFVRVRTREKSTSNYCFSKCDSRYFHLPAYE